MFRNIHIISDLVTGREYNSPVSSIQPTEIKDPEQLIGEVLNAVERFSLSEGSVYMVVEIKDFSLSMKILESNSQDKVLWYNSENQTINFSRKRTSGEVDSLSGQVDASKDKPEYILTAIWSKETLKLGVDSTTYSYP